MMDIRKTLAAAFLAAFSYNVARGQVAVLQMEIDDFRHYTYDVADYSKFATQATETTAVNAKNFADRLCFGDIVAINGKPAKGTQVVRVSGVTLRPNPAPGQSIADIVRNGYFDSILEIMQADGTPVGSISLSGFAGGPPPPGAPLASAESSAVVTGGTGAFLGVRGEFTLAEPGAPEHLASVTEDPSNRRTYTTNATHHVLLHLIPMTWPQVVSTANGPDILHASDFSLVTSTEPAVADEVLTLLVTGLGPTTPGIDPGQPFPASPLQMVNSPVDVTVSGIPAKVLSAAGYPGSTDTYQINFQLPSGITPGMASLRISAAWIAGPAVSIAVQ
ncbi:MAG TPA: hypothetical protein VEV17_20490 [Bryobacteraceae bacterium]|nr:hypothetical protein [Bryobacteraceae bacterium]